MSAPASGPRRAPGSARDALLAVGLVVGALALRLPWLTADLETQVAGVVADDAFYYFELAQRVLAGDGLRFDGQTASTGFHPLWLLLVTPLFAGSEPGEASAVTRVLLLSTGIAAAAGWLLLRLARRLGHATLPAVLLAGAFSANLWLVRESLNGLETLGSVLLLLAAILALLRLLAAPSSGRALGLGAAAGLAILMRSDSAVLMLALYLPLLGARLPPRWLAVAAAPPCLAVALLCGASFALTGSWLQSSATSIPWLVRANWERVFGPEHPPGPVFFASGLRSLLQLGPAGGVALLLGLATLPLALRRDTPLELRRVAGAVALAVGGLALLHFTHGYVRLFPRSWYFVGWVAVAYLALAAGLALLRQRFGTDRRIGIAGLALLFAFELGTTFRDGGEPRYPHQVELLAAGRALSEHVPSGEPIGAFNAGIVAYASRAPVVNLDGVVNGQAARALREGRLAAYLRRRGVRHLVDYPVMWSLAAQDLATGPYFGAGFARVPMRRLARFDRPGVGFPRPEDAVVLERLYWDTGDWNGHLRLELDSPGSERHLQGPWRLPGAASALPGVELRGERAGFTLPFLAGRAYRVRIAAAPVGEGACSLRLGRHPLGVLAASGTGSFEFEIPAGRVPAHGALWLQGAGCPGLRVTQLELQPAD